MANTQVYGLQTYSTRDLYKNRSRIPYSKSKSYVRGGDCDTLNLYICSRFSDDETPLAPQLETADFTAAEGTYYQVAATAGVPLTITLPAAGTNVGSSIAIEQAGNVSFTVSDGADFTYTVPAETTHFIYRFAWNGSTWIVG